MDEEIVLPEEMLKYVTDRVNSTGFHTHKEWAENHLKYAGRWLLDCSEYNDIPMLKNIQRELVKSGCDSTIFTLEKIATIILLFKRGMFLKREPEIPEAVKDLVEGMSWNSGTWKLIVEAYRRGKEAR